MNPLNKIVLGIGAAVALTIAALIVGLAFANARLKTHLAQAQANATVCVAANSDFAAAALRQNKAIEQIKSESSARAQQALAVARDDQKNAHIALRAAEKLKNAQAQGDACQAANALFTSYLKDTP